MCVPHVPLGEGDIMEKRPHNSLHSMGHNKIQNFVHEIKVLFEVGVGGFRYTFVIPVYQRRGGGWMVIRAHNSYRSMVASNFQKNVLGYSSDFGTHSMFQFTRGAGRGK